MAESHGIVAIHTNFETLAFRRTTVLENSQLQEIWLEQTASTMEICRQHALVGKWALVVTKIQTQGRGTKGRVWVCEPGNLFFTLGIPKEVFPIEKSAYVPILTGLVLKKALGHFIPLSELQRVRIKWPNDILIDDRKASGVLIENSSHHYLVGVGMNIDSAPLITDGGRKSACFLELGLTSLEIPLLAKTIASLYQQHSPDVLEPNRLIEEWRRNAAWDLPYQLRNAEKTWVYPREINSAGHLIVEFENGVQKTLIADYLD